MSTEIKPLPQEVKKNGLLYTLVKKGAKAAIYKVTSPDTGLVTAYETFKIKITAARAVFGVPYPAFETFPGNEVFGIWAWCFGCGGDEAKALETAEQRFQAIEDGTWGVEEEAAVETDEDDV